MRQELAKEETPKLWCLLGNCTDDVTCYEKAWEISKHTSARAQRDWGFFYYSKKQVFHHFGLIRFKVILILFVVSRVYTAFSRVVESKQPPRRHLDSPGLLRFGNRRLGDGCLCLSSLLHAQFRSNYVFHNYQFYSS